MHRRRPENELPRLIMTVGLPYSGKTTWCLDHSHLGPVVSPDAIRLSLTGQRYNPRTEPYVWAMARTMVETLFLYGYETVMLDATNVSEQRRGQWVRPSQWRVEYVLLEASAEICRERAMALGDTYILPVIDRMIEQWEPLSEIERRYRFKE